MVVVGEASDLLVVPQPSDQIAASQRGVTSGEGYDRSTLHLTGVQEELIRALQATGKPLVVVLVNGRPLAIPWVKDHVPAVIEAWYPGEEGGHAIAEVLFGITNPSGRLPISFPRSVGHVPVFYNHMPSAGGYYHRAGTPDRPGRDYVEAPPAPLFPFGHGLSYTTFEYAALRVEPSSTTPDSSVTVRMTVRNLGPREGAETVQLYLRFTFRSSTTPVQELKRFAKVGLKPSEGRTIEFVLTGPDLSIIGADMNRVIEPGDVEVMIGASSEDIRLRGRFSVAGDARD